MLYKQKKQNYLRNKKLFLSFLLYFWNLYQILNISQKKMTFIAYVFPKLPTTKNVLRQMSKSSRFREPLDRWHGKRAEALIQY